MAIEFDYDGIVDALNADAEFRLAARRWTARIRVDQGAKQDDLMIMEGHVTGFAPASDGDWDLKLNGPEEEWPALLDGDPKHQYAFFAAVQSPFTMDGSFTGHQAPYGPAIRRMIRVIRNVQGVPVTESSVARDPFEATDTAVGRYIYVDVDGVRYRVYYEEAGEGNVPLLLQHTAGADSRQWRHFLADPRLQKRFRMIAYDLPFHGRSLPPLNGQRWWTDEYSPTKNDLLKWIVAIKRALNLDRPVFLGSSVGGQIAGDLAAEYGSDFGGVIGVNGLYHSDEMVGFDNEPFHNPRVHPEYFASLQYECTSPTAPEEFRREVQWVYAMGGPATYKGDNEYYAFGHDLRLNGHLIDTTVTPYYALAGELDPAAFLPGGAPEIEQNIPGARYFELKNLSHFAMTDDPEAFNSAILPILDQMVAEVTVKSDKAELETARS
jgi:pimeloyl-ACP methyl ester carboxylesterase